MKKSCAAERGYYSADMTRRKEFGISAEEATESGPGLNPLRQAYLD